MDASNYMLGGPKANENYNISMLFGLQQSRSTEDHCETMEEFDEEDIWGSVKDAEVQQTGIQEKGFNAVPVYRSMGVKEGNNNCSRRSAKIPRKESCHEENNRRRMRYQSAPVNIPDWSQMVWEEKKNDNYWRRQGIVDDDSDDNEDGHGTDFDRILVSSLPGSLHEAK